MHNHRDVTNWHYGRSISPTFYDQLFYPKVFCAAFLCLHLGLNFFYRKEISTKAACKLLVKLTYGRLTNLSTFRVQDGTLPTRLASVSEPNRIFETSQTVVRQDVVVVTVTNGLKWNFVLTSFQP